MNDPPIRPSPRSSRNWPPLEFELRGSPRLAAAWVSWCGALALGLWLGCDLPGWWRLALVLMTTIAAWQGARGLLGCCGRVRCELDGRWRYGYPAARPAYVQADPPRCLGPVLWLRWPARGRGHRYWIIDAACVEPNAWRAIKARMRFPGPVRRDHSP
ncbi:MAG: hypothetical protein JSR15_09240 [Proteobacteria bacterium]|nr:hypothetical protein [Pseudomonadota bacterium]